MTLPTVPIESELLDTVAVLRRAVDGAKPNATDAAAGRELLTAIENIVANSSPRVSPQNAAFFNRLEVAIYELRLVAMGGVRVPPRDQDPNRVDGTAVYVARQRAGTL
jgi:hypothetical protein